MMPISIERWARVPQAAPNPAKLAQLNEATHALDIVEHYADHAGRRHWVHLDQSNRRKPHILPVPRQSAGRGRFLQTTYLESDSLSHDSACSQGR
jgi:hypothetical protein